MKVNGKDDILYILENKTCLKPPTMVLSAVKLVQAVWCQTHGEAGNWTMSVSGPALTLAAATGLTEGPPLPLGPPGAPAGGLWGFGKAPLEVELHGTCFCCLFFGVKVDVWTYSWMCPIQELGPMAGYWWLDWNEHPTALTRLMDGIWLQLGHVGRLEYVASLLWTCSLLKGWVIITKDQLLKLGFHE